MIPRWKILYISVEQCFEINTQGLLVLTGQTICEKFNSKACFLMFVCCWLMYSAHRKTETQTDSIGCWSCWWKIPCVMRHPSLSVGKCWSDRVILWGIAHQSLRVSYVAGDCTHCKVLWISKCGVSQSYSTGCSLTWSRSSHTHSRTFVKGWEGLYSGYSAQ
jgi:hypothetical protein